MEPEEFDIELEYTELAKKHNLPGFKEMSQDFDIGKISEKEKTFLAREIRRAINEKISAYIHLFETLINPNAPPMFVFSILKNTSQKDKDLLREIYKKLSKTQIEIMKLDTIYKEEAEIGFINKIFNMWQELKPQIYNLIENLESGFEQNDTSKKISYFD